MAVLEKIRQRSVLLIVVIGLSLFAFIVGDLFNSGGLNSVSKDIGSIDGTDISFEDFRVKVSNVEKSGQGITPTQAVNRVWDQEVVIALYTKQFDLLGIRAGEKAIMNVIKSDQNIGQNPLFLNAAGVFDEAKFKEYFRANPEQAQIIKAREKEAELSARYEIYDAMVKGGMYATEAEGKLQYKIESEKVSFDYVSVLYSTIKDSDVKVSDAEIVDFMKKNEKKNKADETRELEYVLIKDVASPEDEAEVKTTVDALLNSRIVYNQATAKNDTLPGFRFATNNAEFVNENSDIPYDSSYVAKNRLPAAVAEQLFNLPQGEIYGPYMNGEYYCISKSLGKKAGASAQASHILISYEGTQVPNKKEKRTKEQAKAKAESLFAQAQANPSSFQMLALMNSDDSSSQRGGDLGEFSPGQMVKPFNDFVFNNPVGKIGLVETDFGFHIIDITNKQDAIRLATIAQKIEPSDATTDKIYQEAVKFEMDANDKDFAAVAKEAKMTVNPPVTLKVMDENFGAVGNQRQIVRWAFEKATKVGDVKRFEIANVGNVIVKYKKLNDAGLLAIDQARIAIEPELKNKKKAAIIEAKMKGSTLDAVAKAAGSTIQQAVDVTIANATLPNVGPERKVVGTAIGIGVNKVSSPIQGNAGVYVVNTKAITPGLVLKNFSDYTSKLKQQASSYSSRVIPALKADADIVDNRAKFNY